MPTSVHPAPGSGGPPSGRGKGRSAFGLFVVATFALLLLLSVPLSRLSPLLRSPVVGGLLGDVVDLLKPAFTFTLGGTSTSGDLVGLANPVAVVAPAAPGAGGTGATGTGSNAGPGGRRPGIVSGRLPTSDSTGPAKKDHGHPLPNGKNDGGRDGRGHGNGHANGHGNGHANGHGNGNGHAHGNGHDHP